MAENDKIINHNVYDENYREHERSEWALYDANVQSYRSSMISSQSLLMAVAAIFYDSHDSIVLAICLVGLIIQWYIWFRVIRSRTLIADYHKFNYMFELSKKLNSKGEAFKEGSEGETHLSEKNYLDHKVQSKASDWLAEITGETKYKKKFRLTRLKLDLILPLLFSVIWVIISLKSIRFYWNLIITMICRQ